MRASLSGAFTGAVGAALLLLVGCVGLCLLLGPAKAAGTGCTMGSASGKHALKPCWRPFSSSSPFNRRLPAAPRQPGDSALIGARTADFGPAPAFEVGNEGTPDDYNHPVYFSRQKDPLFRVKCLKFGGRCEVENQLVHIPRRAEPAGGSDGHLGIIDLKRGWVYDFWQVRDRKRGGGRLAVSFGGRTRIGKPGADGLGSNATAAHFSTAAGAIRPDELRSGLIDHALFMTVQCTNGRSVWPARGGPGQTCRGMGLSNFLAPAMGQHFFLAMSHREIDALTVPPWKKTILTAMADYGMFVGDTGGVAWGFKLWTGLKRPGHPDPWIDLATRLKVPTYIAPDGSTRFHFDMRGTVPWERRLRVASPCVAAHSC